MVDIRNYGELAKNKCVNSPEFKLKQEEIATSKCVNGEVVASELEIGHYDGTVAYEMLKDAVTCPPFVHTFFEIGNECPAGFEAVRNIELSTGAKVVECLGIITDATVSAGDPGSGYLAYHC